MRFPTLSALLALVSHHYRELQGFPIMAHDLELQGLCGIFPHPSMPCRAFANAIYRARSLFFPHLHAKVRKIIDICKSVSYFCGILLVTFVVFYFLSHYLIYILFVGFAFQ